VRDADVEMRAVEHGSELEDTGSIFQAHLCALSNADGTAAALHAICRDERVRRAACMPWAYRLVERNGSVRRGCDDGGEAGAASRLAE
jgi:putative IMPACT (imprinted ancient) family translation regulator